MRPQLALMLLAAYAAAQIIPPCDPDKDPDCDSSDMENTNGVTAPEVIELIDGFLIGALEVEQVDNLDTCIKDFTPFVTDMVTAVNDFEDGSYWSIADGIYQLGQFISEVGIVMEDCAQVG